METPRFIDIYRRFSCEIHEDFYFFGGVSQLAMFDDTGYKKRQFFIRLVGSAPIGSAQGAPSRTLGALLGSRELEICGSHGPLRIRS